MYGEGRENPPTVPFKAVLFDLYGTLAYVENPVDGDHVSRILVKRGYEVYPQAWDTAWKCVAFVDYPRYGHRNWRAYLKGVFQRLGLKPDEETLSHLVKIYETVLWKPYPDSENALKRAKQLGLKTAVVTSVARFMFEKSLKTILNKVDMIVDGYTFRCEKSNPKIYLRTLAALWVEPAQAVMIGDDLAVDVKLPEGLGLKAILVDRESKHSAKPHHADAVVKDLNSAMEFVSKGV